MHPLVEKDTEYLQVKVQYEHCPNLLFWDNANDIYEIFEDVDAAIIDYSSIFMTLWHAASESLSAI